MSRFRSMARNHLHFIVVVGFLLIVMTWPTIVYVFDTETFWLPTDNRDVFSNIWDAWHGRSVFAGEALPYFTDMLFYPTGLSLVYNPNNLIQRTLLWMFQFVMGTSNAFNLVYLLIVVATAVSAYIYINYLFKDRWLALFGAVVFGFSQHVVGHPNHPMVNLLATIPLSLCVAARHWRTKVEMDVAEWLFGRHYRLHWDVYSCLSAADARIVFPLLHLLEMAPAAVLDRNSSFVCCGRFGESSSYLSNDQGHCTIGGGIEEESGRRVQQRLAFLLRQWRTSLANAGFCGDLRFERSWRIELPRAA